MYRSGVKPWHSANWKPHLMDELHNKTDREASESNEKQVAQD
jgi:MFS transporter, SP family, sugar:H+ symporter